MERWPTADEVLAVLKARWPEKHSDTVSISFTPGFGGYASADDVAEALHNAIVQARKAMDQEHLRLPSSAPLSRVKPFNVIEIAKAVPEKKYD